jgi:hypothetical protein
MKIKLISLMLAALCTGGSAFAYTPGPVTGGGTLTGTVRFTGAVPAAPRLPVTKDPQVCGTDKPNEVLLVSPTKGVANAVVFIDKIEHGKPLVMGKAELDNTSCRYEPHVQAFAVGTELHVKNEDAVLHNTHIRLPTSDVFNYALPEKGQVIKKKVTRPGLMKVGCDAGHTWMAAWIAVFEHPYFAVTDKDGRFTLGDVPAGEYTLMFWHEKLGKASQKVTVTAGGTLDASHAYK